MSKDLGMVFKIAFRGLDTQSVIDAKARAIMESCDRFYYTWQDVYYRDHLADPACHYEPLLPKLSEEEFDQLIDIVDDAFRDIISDTPALIFGMLQYLDTTSREAAFAGVKVLMQADRTALVLRQDKVQVLISNNDEIKVYALKEVKHK